MTKQADLIAYVFDGQAHPFAGILLQWMESSTRFTTFVEIYRDKVRKKIRVSREPETMVDLQSELEVAFCLLSDRRLAITYEPYASARRRGPDFAVTYRENLIFNIEVARLRVEEDEIDESNIARKQERLLRIVVYKLSQMQPGMANLLVIHTRDGLARTIELDRLMQILKTRVEKKDLSFYNASIYTSPAAFYKDFLHLSGVLLWTGASQLWINKQARPPLDEKVQRLVMSLSSISTPG